MVQHLTQNPQRFTYNFLVYRHFGEKDCTMYVWRYPIFSGHTTLRVSRLYPNTDDNTADQHNPLKKKIASICNNKWYTFNQVQLGQHSALPNCENAKAHFNQSKNVINTLLYLLSKKKITINVWMVFYSKLYFLLFLLLVRIIQCCR